MACLSFPRRMLSWWALAVIVADRENNRLQVFTLDGDHVANWPCHRACGLTTCQDGFVYVGQAGGPNPAYGAVTNIGQRVMIFDREGQEVQYIGGSGGERPDQFNVRPAKQPTGQAILRRILHSLIQRTQPSSGHSTLTRALVQTVAALCGGGLGRFNLHGRGVIHRGGARGGPSARAHQPPQVGRRLSPGLLPCYHRPRTINASTWTVPGATSSQAAGLHRCSRPQLDALPSVGCSSRGLKRVAIASPGATPGQNCSKSCRRRPSSATSSRSTAPAPHAP